MCMVMVGQIDYCGKIIFDNELDKINSHLLAMGGLVESQVAKTMKAFATMDIELADEVLLLEKEVNQLELNIDAECAEILAMRQPAARDLRLVLAVTKAASNLERVGDEADHIAARIKKIFEAALRVADTQSDTQDNMARSPTDHGGTSTS